MSVEGLPVSEENGKGRREGMREGGTGGKERGEAVMRI